MRRNSKTVPCNRVGSGLSHHITCAPESFAILRGIGVREDVELAHCIDPQELPAHPAGRNRELAGSRVFNAVHEEDILGWAAAVHRKRVPVAGAGICAFQVVSQGARIQRDQIVEAAPVERKVFDLPLIDDTRILGRWSC